VHFYRWLGGCRQSNICGCLRFLDPSRCNQGVIKKNFWTIFSLDLFVGFILKSTRPLAFSVLASWIIKILHKNLTSWRQNKLFRCWHSFKFLNPAFGMDKRLLGLHLLTPAFGLLTALRGITALLGAQQQIVFENCRIYPPKCGAKHNPTKIRITYCKKYVLVLSCSLLLQIHFRLAFFVKCTLSRVFLWFLFQAWPHISP
jgi:hypothetical protein